MKLKYLDSLRANVKQDEIEYLLEKYKVQPVGTGYIDMITSKENIEPLINDLTILRVIVEGVTWWCHCTKSSEQEQGCPHGMGGPRSKYYDGWFSETQIKIFEIHDNLLESIHMNEELPVQVKAINDSILMYVKNDFPKDKDYKECLIPALWLLVPDDWERLRYLTT